MKQSVDLMNSMKLMNSRHSNTTTTTSLARRALLLLTLFVMSVGSAWGQTFNGTLIPGAKTYSKYIKNNVYTTTIDMTEDLSQIVSDLNELKGSSDYTIDNIYQHIYIRWCIKDASNNIVTSIIENGYSIGANDWHVTSEYLYNNAPWKPTNGNIFWFYTYNYLYQDADFKAKILKPQFTINSGKTFADYDGYTLECYITDETDGLTYAEHPEWGQTGSITSEPANLKIKYTYVFNATGKKPDTFINGKSSSCIERSNTITLKPENGYNSAENSITISSLPANWPAVNAKYVRWFVIDGTDDAVNESKDWLTQPTDFVSDSEGSHGWYWFSDTPMSTSSLSIPKLTIGAGKNLEDYRLIAVFSDEEGTLSGTDLTKEPEYDYWYTFSFEHPFKAETISNTIEKTLTVGPTDWLQNLKVTFDYTTSEIKLLDQNSVELSKASIAETLWETSGYSGGTLSAPFYVRWFLQDAVTGNEKYIAGALDGTSAYEIPEKDRYGLYWSSSRKSESNLSNIMQMTVKGTKADLSSCNLVCTIATDLDGIIPTDNSVALSHEPNTMVQKYVFKFVDSDWAGTESPTWTHTKEVLVNNTQAAAGKVTIPLADSYTKILLEYGVDGKTLGENLHMRWYVTYKGQPIYSQSQLTPKAGQGYDNIGKLGVYWNANTSGVANPLESNPSESSSKVSDLFNVSFSKPTEGEWHDYKVIVVMSNDLSTQLPTGTPTELTHEPTTLNMKYIFSLFEESAFRFVHAKGDSNRSYVTSGSGTNKDSRIKTTDPAAAKQYSWNVETSEVEDADRDIRQGVHTVELEMYVKAGEDPRPLLLPLEDYNSSGNVLEPNAYFRWYDWTTDLGCSKLTPAKTKAEGSWLEQKSDESGDRGYFMLNRNNIEKKPYHNRVGVTFNTTGFTSGTEVIACDVSKYFDGIYAGSESEDRNDFGYGSTKPVMLHEPTLSLRYIFTIRPASVIMDKITGSVSETRGSSYFDDVVTKLNAGTTTYADVKNTMFNLCEDNGRVIVSMKDGASKFSVRTQLPTFGDYYITGTKKCSEVQWYAYYEDAEGLWRNPTALSSTLKSSDGRITTFSLSSLSGDYTLLSSPSKTKTGFTPSFGSTVHFIGCLGDGTDEEEVVHYEMQFIEAPAVLAENLGTQVGTLKTDVETKKATYDTAKATYDAADADYKAKKAIYDSMSPTDPGYAAAYTAQSDALSVYTGAESAYNVAATNYNTALTAYNNKVKRTKGYLEDNYDSQGVVDFNKYFNGAEPTSQSENIRFEPLEWNEAQYGFCYPNIDRFRIATGYSGLTPIHGDYMLLKSINKSDVSTNSSSPYDLHFYSYGSNTELDDYTKTMGGDWGGFIYVDASDESRTIATLDFDADLCHGSQIYFTAAIADVTQQTKPQIMAKVYGVKSTGDVLVMSFMSGVLNTVHEDTYQEGKWYQVYGEGTIPESVDLTGVTSYKVEIVNFAQNTFGADYCVDEIRFYTSTGQMTVEQAGGLCYGDQLQLTAYVPAEQLSKRLTLSTTAPQTIYYRIFKKTSEENVKPVTYEVCDNESTLYNNGSNLYGQVDVYQYVLEADGTIDTEKVVDGNKVNKGYFINEKDGQVYFKITDTKTFQITPGYDYFFALTESLSSPNTGTSLSNWADPNDACDVFSNFFVPKKLALDFMDGTNVASTVLGGGCSGGGASSISDFPIVLKYPTDTETKTYSNVHFDFYVGDTYDADIIEAMRNFRQDYPSSTSFDDIDAAKPYKATLDAAKANIILANSTTLPGATLTGRLTAGVNYFLAMPVETATDPDALPICSPIVFTFTLNASVGKPELGLGFDDVTYPSDYTRVIRVGLTQLNNAKASGSYTLHIPVHSFKDKNAATTNSIVFDNANLTLRAIYGATGSNTTDPTKTTANAVIATLQDDTSAGRPMVNNTHKYLAVKFANDFTFYEGYQYELHTVYYDSEDDDSGAPATGACTDDLYLIIKVVPEYVTWNDEGTTVTPNTNVGTNWSNDANWSRSSKAELYSTTYQDNTDINASLTPTPATYMPMKFTYVTIPTGNVAPKLINLAKGTDGIYNNIGTGATSNIQYDMMVKVENECAHGVSGDIYDCEKFYSNICKEIYFKPSAELINQQYLTYEKAWVEKEMTSNTWYLMSTPLRDTYAGDMFVPLSATATKNGRQETEAFQAITFPDQADATYSRTKYPFYQHSWGSTFGSTVRVASNDNYRTDYSAKLQSSAVTETAFANWGHSFNDVQEPYTTRTAFAIRAHKKTQGTAALIRLPKTNTTYNYFDWKDTNPTVDPKTSGVKTITKDGYGKLLVDKDQNATQFEVAVATLQSVGGYVLVGNPYMASIDMTSFLAANSLTGYWTYEGSAVTAMTDGKIRPLQGFFVKKESGNITFTPAMMVDGNHATDTPAPAREFTLTASSNRGQSTASVSMGEEEKSVETLFDSNLADVPMVYTVADGQAVSINQVKELSKPIAFGVTCTASNEMVDVTFSDIEKLTSGEVYVVDAVDGTSQQIYEGDSFAVQPNDYGRYFLTFTGGSATGIEETASAQQGIVVSVRGREVTVTSGEDIAQIQAVSLNGSTIYQNNNCGNSVTFMLHAGVYVIQAKNIVGAQQNVKIFVK